MLKRKLFVLTDKSDDNLQEYKKKYKQNNGKRINDDEAINIILENLVEE